ncbi:ExbD/TolR family protein [Wielerella bovis]|uniref:ExbD/TolR family protein n=1 Tax=Wielerella bovis TaxID=2917790 RepID=UPI002019A214|nr:biopolymer transporter ExbD [Wielerella bovis]ULJ65215.1 biopolymer transporter ExbD [Wielerella bovis]ULJ67561.1 biopolymer transporter ExbD [Wielerella bovis]
MAFGSMNDGDDAPMSDINVTPLVDVMLVLLIVFMITMPVLTHSIPLNLPTANSQSQTPPKMDVKPIEVAIDAAGAYAVGADSEVKVDLETVRQQFTKIAQENPDTVVAIDADETVAYEHVVKVLEAAREAGLSKVGFRMKTEAVK